MRASSRDSLLKSIQLLHDFVRAPSTMAVPFILALLCVSSFNASLHLPMTVAPTTQLRYLALGDSYTIGEAVDEVERFPAQLASALRKYGVDVADPCIIARTGWTTGELNAAIDTQNPDGQFDLVTLLIGVNNQYRGRSRDEYREEFIVLLRRAISFAGGSASRVIVVSIPDWGVMPFAEGRDRQQIAADIDSFNAINWEESVRAKAHYVDITAISREAQRYTELIASDGLHPSAVQYRYWVEIIEPKAVKALQIEKDKR